MISIAEVPHTRETYGWDERAINRHSVRLYVTSTGAEYTLDRTLDGRPPFYSLWRYPGINLPFRPVLGKCVPVAGEDYWGDGWHWKRAERAARQAIQDYEVNLP